MFYLRDPIAIQQMGYQYSTIKSTLNVNVFTTRNLNESNNVLCGGTPASLSGFLKGTSDKVLLKSSHLLQSFAKFRDYICKYFA